MVSSKLNNLHSVGSRTSKLLPFDGGIFNTGKKLTSTFSVLRLTWWLRLKNLPAIPETWIQSLGQEDPLQKEMATHSSIPFWRIPWVGILEP